MSHFHAFTVLIALAFTSGAVADDAPTKRPVEAGKKAVTVISLTKLGGKPNAEILKLMPEAATAALVDDGQSLLIYADEKTTNEIVQFVRKLEDVLRKKATVIPVPGGDPEETVIRLRKFFSPSTGVTILPVRGEQAVIVYATEAATKEIQQVLVAVSGIANENAMPKIDEKRYTLQFQNAAWDAVFKWYAEASGLTGKYAEKPIGTVTISPPKGRQFTLGEATDLINEALAQSKYILVRNARTFAVWPADEPIDRTLVPRVELSQLVQRGQTELVEVEIVLPANVDANAWAPELKKLLTPFGSVVPFQGKRLVILDTAGSVRRLADLVSTITNTQKPMVIPKKPKAELKKFPPATRGVPVPWSTVLEWYAEATGLMPILPAMPKGTVELGAFSNRECTIAEITDILNEALAQQRFMLIRRQATFFIHSTDEKIDYLHIPLHCIDVSELQDRGKTELVQVLIPLKTLQAKETAPEIQKLLTPCGRISALEKTNTLVLLDTAGNLSRIWNLLQKIDGKMDQPQTDSRNYPILRKYAVPAGTADAIAKSFQSDMPKIKALALPTTNEILVMATEEEHADIATKLKALNEEKKPKPDK
jgi:hypothetical protein